MQQLRNNYFFGIILTRKSTSNNINIVRENLFAIFCTLHKINNTINMIYFFGILHSIGKIRNPSRLCIWTNIISKNSMKSCLCHSYGIAAFFCNPIWVNLNVN